MPARNGQKGVRIGHLPIATPFGLTDAIQQFSVFQKAVNMVGGAHLDRADPMLHMPGPQLGRMLQSGGGEDISQHRA